MPSKLKPVRCWAVRFGYPNFYSYQTRTNWTRDDARAKAEYLTAQDYRQPVVVRGTFVPDPPTKRKVRRWRRA